MRKTLKFMMVKQEPAEEEEEEDLNDALNDDKTNLMDNAPDINSFLQVQMQE